MSITTKLTIEDTAVNDTYQDVTGTTSGSGTGAKFDVVKTDGKYTVTLDSVTSSAGSGYVAGDTITIAGTNLGGTAPDHNLIVTVGTVGTGGKIATFGAVGTGRVGDGDIDVTFAVKGTIADKESFTIQADLDDLNIAVSNTGVVTLTHDDLDNVSVTLTDIERLVGTDHAIAFDVTGKAGEVYALVAAAFGEADVTEDLMGEYLVMADAGLTDTQIANAILFSPEYAADALGTGNETFIKQVWKNVTGQLPDLLTLNTLTKVLDDKIYAKADLLEAASNLALWRDASHLDFATLKTTGIKYNPDPEA